MTSQRLSQHAWLLHRSVPGEVLKLKEVDTNCHPWLRRFIQLIVTWKWKFVFSRVSDSGIKPLLMVGVILSNGSKQKMNSVALVEVLCLRAFSFSFSLSFFFDLLQVLLYIMVFLHVFYGIPVCDNLCILWDFIYLLCFSMAPYGFKRAQRDSHLGLWPAGCMASGNWSAHHCLHEPIRSEQIISADQ